MNKFLVIAGLLIAGTSAFAEPSIVCNQVDLSATYDQLFLSKDMMELTLTQSPMPGAPTFRIENAYQVKADQKIVIQGSVRQAIPCRGTCDYPQFELTISTTRVYPNGFLTVTKTNFNDANPGEPTQSKIEEHMTCSIENANELPAFHGL